MTRIAVIGEYFTDVYHIGKVRGISAEAPIPIIDLEDTEIFDGGAANVAANVESLGAEAFVVYQQQMATQKNRLMVGDHQVARWDDRDGGYTPYSDEVLAERLPHVAKCDGVIISDYGKGMFTPKFIKQVALASGALPVFIDTKQDPFLFTPFHNPFYFPNLSEYRQFRTSYEDLDNVVLKRGAEGLQLGDYKVPALAHKVVSVNGAGDTVIAAFTVSYLITKDTTEALNYAAKAAARAVAQPYTTAVTAKELNNYYGLNPVR